MEPKIVWETDSQRQVLSFRASGSDLQCRVEMKTSGSLTPVTSDTLAAAVADQHCPSLAAYERIRAELVKVAKELVECEREAERSLAKYSAAVAVGGNVAAARDELSTARHESACLKEQHESLSASAIEARAVAVRGVGDLITEKKAERFEIAKSRLDSAISRIAEAIAAELGELAESRIEFRHASHDSASADRLVAPLPTSEPELEPAGEELVGA